MPFSTDVPTLGANDRRLDHRGERRLMLAVLEDALRTICGARIGRTNPTWMRRELDWLCSDDASHPFGRKQNDGEKTGFAFSKERAPWLAFAAKDNSGNS